MRAINWALISKREHVPPVSPPKRKPNWTVTINSSKSIQKIEETINKWWTISIESKSEVNDIKKITEDFFELFSNHPLII